MSSALSPTCYEGELSAGPILRKPVGKVWASWGEAYFLGRRWPSWGGYLGKRTASWGLGSRCFIKVDADFYGYTFVDWDVRTVFGGCWDVCKLFTFTIF